MRRNYEIFMCDESILGIWDVKPDVPKLAKLSAAREIGREEPTPET
jgi:hypothetical protein